MSNDDVGQKFRFKLTAIMIIVVMLCAGCISPETTATPAAPTHALTFTPRSPTAVSATPMGTTIPPTDTPVLPTASPSPEASAPPPPSFSLEKSAQTFTSRETVQIGLGDLDGDGDLDAVFANPQKNAAQAWLNDGRGHFTDTGQELTQYGHGVSLADLDGDGDLDAFIVCHQPSASITRRTSSMVYLNAGDGRFQDSGQDFGDAEFSAVEVNLLDLDGDGDLDAHVVYFDFDGLPDKIYLNDGAGVFTDSGLVLPEDTIAWGDLDGDGDTDYFGKHWGTGYTVQLNDGSGLFHAGWQLDDSQSTVGGVALADFDGDGDLDAVVTNGFGDTGSYLSRLFWNDGAGNLRDSGQSLNATMGAELATGDLDNDGDLDLFVANMDWPNEVWLNDGSGTLVDSRLRLGKKADLSGRPSLGDLDGDSDLDVVVGRFQSGAEIWINPGETEKSAGSMGAPFGNPPTIDGTHSSGEWDAARIETFADGSTLLLMRDEEYLYLGLQANEPGMIAANVFLQRGDEIAILHVSAALGTAIYQRGEGDGWHKIQDFTWQCRDTSLSAAAQAERAAFLQQEGWVAANGRMGTPNELEYQVKIPAGDFRLAAVYLKASPPYEKVPWPAELTDDTVRPTPGGFPAELQFSPEQWLILEIQQ